MPIAFLTVGTIFVVVAVNGTAHEFLYLLRKDFTGPNNFLLWLLAIGMIGALGYVDELEPIANGFFVILVIGMLLANNPKGRPGFFESFTQQIKESQHA